MAEFIPTHTLRDIPVQQVVSGTGRPKYLDKYGKVVHWGRGAKLIPLLVPQPAPPAPVAVVEPEVEEEVLPVGSEVFLPAEAAAAALRAAAFPIYGESVEHAETVSGHSALLLGREPDGTAVVRVAVRRGTNQQDVFHWVRVPAEISFQTAEPRV